MRESIQKTKQLARTIQGSGKNQKVGFVDNRIDSIIQMGKGRIKIPLSLYDPKKKRIKYTGEDIGGFQVGGGFQTYHSDIYEPTIINSETGTFPLTVHSEVKQYTLKVTLQYYVSEQGGSMYEATVYGYGNTITHWEEGAH